MAVAGEHEDVRRIRRRAADASMGFGLVAVLVAVLSSTGPMLPGYALLAIGGLAGIGVYAASDTTVSRWFTAWSAGLTVLGVVALVVVG
ncbi:hypothetical protein [Winogradskya humida]|uniref:Uncharacterized protein n=1 Tax=Winogradskya humida TaxID=113566 RepID=A0ABQ4A4M0_9ACTN|nr:hypothetical protein [Actinoplanes humidus]GIE25805.1 hypothetical protein Ahu01nite_089070 [Actinoplanes humidus]